MVWKKEGRGGCYKIDGRKNRNLQAKGLLFKVEKTKRKK